MVVDFHTHCFPEELAPRAVSELAAKASIPARLGGTIDEIKTSMKRAGIDYSVILSIATKPSQEEKVNNWAASVQGDGIISFGSIHPDSADWKSELSRIKSLGMKGVKFHPEYQNFYVDDEKMLGIYDCCAELGLVVSFHCGVDLGFEPPYHCTPDRLAKVVGNIPEGRFVAAHMGGYQYWDEVEKHLVGKNVYFDTSFILGHINTEQLKRIFDHHDSSKLLFATDSPWCDQREEIRRVKALELDKEFEAALLGGNAGRLLGLDL